MKNFILTAAIALALSTSIQASALSTDEAIGSLENDRLGKFDGPSYPTFYTNGHTFDDNSETGFLPRLTAFAKDQEKIGKIDEPVRI